VPQEVVTMMSPDRILEITPSTFVWVSRSSAFTWVDVTVMRQTAAKKHRTVEVFMNVIVAPSFE
jgi:hypothetical protein